jgi:hypothetical protein
MTRRAPEPVLLLGDIGDPEAEADAYRAMRRLARLLIRREDAASAGEAPGEPDGRRRDLRPLLD